MNWTEFLNEIENQVCLVGPRMNGPFLPTLPTIYVDGGHDFAEPSAAPSISVGDGDSARAQLDKTLPTEKDFSDLAFVLRGLPDSIEVIEMHGFLGGRRDHELANFGEVHAFLLEQPARVRFFDDATVAVTAFRGRAELNIHGIFSVMVFASGNVRISGDCAYKWQGVLQPASSLGLSNVGHGRVVVESAGPCFVFQLAPST